MFYVGNFRDGSDASDIWALKSVSIAMIVAIAVIVAIAMIVAIECIPGNYRTAQLLFT